MTLNFDPMDAKITSPDADFSNLDTALDYVFSYFTHRHNLHKNKHDRDFRRPEVLIEIAKNLNLLPVAARTCLVTGSKGKGTVSRMIGWNLAAAGLRVGLVVTPEEVTHLDRIRIGNNSILAADFCRILTLLRPALDKALQQQSSDFYFSPAGVFLLIALKWFKEQNVDSWVIEGGRGARFDEIGQLDAAIGVVTNILPEHLTRIGPTVADVAADKLSLANRCQNLVIGASVLQWQNLITNPDCHLQAVDLASNQHKTVTRPQWFDALDTIAFTAAQQLYADLRWQCFDTPAFFFAAGGIRDGKIIAGTICCDAAIHPDCLDADFLQRTGLTTGAALIGLSQDKEGDGIVAKLTAAGFVRFYTVALSSRVGHIHAWTTTDGVVNNVATLDVIADNEADLAQLVSELVEKHRSLYVVGVQLFIRTLRQILKVEVAKPKPLN